MQVLKLSRCGRDLTEAQEASILDIDNGDWKWTHWCLGASLCKAKCGGKPGVAKQLMVDAAELASGKLPATPLEYRWKGVEQFMGVMYRARRQHDILLGTHRMIWPAKDVRRAQEEIARLSEQQGSEGMSNDQLRFKQQIRGGMSVEMMEADPEAIRLERCIVLQSGIQLLLNKWFPADKAVSKYTSALQHSASGDSLEGGSEAAQELRKLRQDCIDRNLEIISGTAGENFLHHYSKFFNYSASVWEDWRMQAEGKYQTCLDLICIQQEVEYRLVFKLQLAKLEVFKVCQIPEGIGFSGDEVARIADKILQARRACDKCVDRAFAYVWAYRLKCMGAAMSRRAHTHLCDVLAVLRVTSSNVERKHLIGQEELKPKTRGAGPKCSQVGIRVFRHSVRRGGELAIEEAKRQCLPDKRVWDSFHQSLGEDRPSDRRTKEVASAGAARKSKRGSKTGAEIMKVTPQRGYDVFVSQHYDAAAETQDGSDHAFSKRKVVDSKWSRLPQELKDVFNAVAHARNEADASLSASEDFAEFFKWSERVGANGGTRNSTKNHASFKSRRARAIQRTLSKLINHPIFDNSIHDFEAGFKSKLVCKDLARHEVREQMSDIFDYDHIPATNPKAMPFFQPCSQTNGGFCSKRDGIDMASILTYNLYMLGGRDWKPEYPVLLQVSDPHDGFVLWWWLGKLVWKGNLAFLTPATVTDDGSGERRAEVKAGSRSDQWSMPIASYKAFLDFLLAWQRGQGPAVDFRQLDALQARRWKFKRDTTATTFRVVLDAECDDALQLSCKERVKVSSSKTKAHEATGSMFDLGTKPESSLVVVRKSTKSAREVDEEPKRRVRRKTGVVDDDSDSDCSAADLNDSDGSSSEASEAHSDHRSSRSGDGNSVDGDGADSDPGDDDDAALDAEPWNSVGIKSWEVVSARAKAQCEFCKLPIKQTDDSRIRLDYRFKVSHKLADQKRLHPSCASHIPAENRERDIKVIKR